MVFGDVIVEVTLFLVAYKITSTLNLKFKNCNNLIMELIVGIIPSVKGNISVVTGNSFQATIEIG